MKKKWDTRYNYFCQIDFGNTYVWKDPDGDTCRIHSDDYGYTRKSNAGLGAARMIRLLIKEWRRWG